MTNYEYIRNLPPEEMADEFHRVDWCDSSCAYGEMQDKCRECLLKWLKSERKESENQ